MKLLVLTFSTNNTNPGLKHLLNSLNRFGYDHKMLIGNKFTWGGDNYIHIAEWLKSNRADYTHFLYTDAWDTLAMATQDFIPDYLKGFGESFWLWSGEKNCYPHPHLAHQFKTNGRWKYLNAGQYIVDIDYFIKIVENEPRKEGQNDQDWATLLFLSGKYNMYIDDTCKLFQTLYMEAPDEFAWTRNGRLYNRVTNTYPVFIHGNGKVDMRHIYHPPSSPFYG